MNIENNIREIEISEWLPVWFELMCDFCLKLLKM